ncbi:hypothetical protein BST61_g7107 [Cercospora zeina]
MSGHFGYTPPSGTNGEPSTYNPLQDLDGGEPHVYTSIRYDRRLPQSASNTAASCGTPCSFYMLEHHWTRLQVAKWSTFFFADDRPRPNSGGPTVLLNTLTRAVKQWHEQHPDEQPEALRVKLRIYVGGRMTTEIFHPLRSIPMESLFPKSFKVKPNTPIEWTIVLDSEPTEPSEGTMYKTNDRSSYGRARAAAQILTYQIPREVLLYTPGRVVLDGSICTPYFFRDGEWVTPEAAAGGLQGTTRRWALTKELCVEGNISIDSFQDGETVWLSNAVRGYFPAVFKK